MEKILLDAKTFLSEFRYQLMKQIFDDYYNNPFNNNSGDAFPIEEWARLTFGNIVLMGSDWEGELNLKDPIELLKFKNYVSK